VLIGKVLNSQATLNNFIYIGTLLFVPGLSLKINMRLFDDELNLRFVIEDPNATVKIILNKSNNLQEEVNGIFINGDHSLVQFSLTSLQTQDLLGGNVVIEIDEHGDGSSILQAMSKQALSKEILVGGC
jgi:flagellar capping protein FliD